MPEVLALTHHTETRSNQRDVRREAMVVLLAYGA